MSILEELAKPLEASDVECRIGTTNATGFSLLLYKTARTDIKRLNSVCGLNWSNKHSIDNNGNVTCEISLYDETTKQWFSRHDTGTESFTEKEKGSYSDSFKRAGFRFGIGLELYESPFIWIKWEMKDKKPVGFYGCNVTKYQVVNGEPQVEICVKGKVIFSNYKVAKVEQRPADEVKPPMNISPHGTETTQQCLDDAQAKLDKITTLEDLEAFKTELKAKGGTALYFQKHKATEALTTLTAMINTTEAILKEGE